MTFIPNVLSHTDDKNSGTILSDKPYSGTSSYTVGYNSILVSIENDVDSSVDGLVIEFSDDGDDLTFTSFYTDTYTANTKYEKTFPLLKQYYRIGFVNATLIGTSTPTGTITTRLMTAPEKPIFENNLTIYHSIDDSNNSTSTLLTSGSNTFEGTPKELTGFNSIVLSIESDVSSSTNGIQIQFSNTNSNFKTFFYDTYTANQKYEKSFKVLKNYYRVVYNNGSTDQTNFNLTSRISTASIFENSNSSTNIIEFNNELESSKDAFNKLRVSNPYTLLDIKFPQQTDDGSYPDNYLQNNMMINYKESGSGTITTTFGNSCAVYSIEGDGSTSSIISQSRKYCTYQPGKSLLFLASSVINDVSNSSTDYQSYIGYFDEANGSYFLNDSGTIYIGLRDSGTGSPNDTTISQSDWNIDPLNGNGPSGVNLDFSKTQLYVIDFEWLGVGRIRYGFYLYGKIYYCHQILNVNTLLRPYMQTANLPIRHQLVVNDSGVAKLTQICSSVISEGGYNPIGRSFSTNNGTSPIEIDSNETNILAITGNASYLHQNVIPSFINIIAGSNDAILYFIKIIFNASTSLSSTTWTDVDTNSVIKYSRGSSIVIADGDVVTIDSSYAIGKNTVNLNELSKNFNNFLQLTSTIDNNPDIILISAQKVTNGTTLVFSSISWQEIY